MLYRYSRRKTLQIDKRDMFKQIKARRDLDSVGVYSTPKFNKITEIDLESLNYQSYIWKRGDKFYKLSHEFYKDSTYWWVIALFNNAPTEQHIKIGEEIFIPSEPDSVANLLGVS